MSLYNRAITYLHSLPNAGTDEVSVIKLRWFGTQEEYEEVTNLLIELARDFMPIEIVRLTLGMMHTGWTMAKIESGEIETPDGD